MNNAVNTKKNILAEGRNCWRAEHSHRAAFLIDGQSCFKAMRQAMINARQRIFIIGWDLHSEIRLVRDEPDDGYPQVFSELLEVLTQKNPDLQIFILEWDFAMIYAVERELFPYYKMKWMLGDRVHFNFDSHHPMGGSQHQKLLVIDDSVAFSGGLDLTRSRWDTPEHLPDDPRRINNLGLLYKPFHDVNMIMEGAAARAIAELARRRWKSAIGVGLEPLPESSADLWPACVEPDLHDVKIAISRTIPEYVNQPEVREVEALYLDSIASARKFIYIENQYFSSHAIGEALLARLIDDNGPEIVIVLPEKISGWLEHSTMDALRSRLVSKLKKADRHHRLRVYYVRLQREPHVSLMIHAKVMIIDDRFARVASSNLSSRSMGLDSECDVAIEATEMQQCEDQIRKFRHKLLSEHLGLSVDKICKTEKGCNSLIKTIEQLAGAERTLVPFTKEMVTIADAWVPDSAIVDPERPVDPAELFDLMFLTKKERKEIMEKPKKGRFFWVITALVALILTVIGFLKGRK